MDTRHQSPVQPAHPGVPPSNSGSAATIPCFKNFALAESSTATQSGVETEHKELIREPKRQALFQTNSNKALELPDGYLKVAVLMIRWDESIDDFKDRHTEEIARLERIFVDDYGYTCKVHSIQNFKKPQVDLNRAILNHIYEHDGPNSLLIFYYTGHGYQSGVNGLELSANQDFTNMSASHMPTAFWNRAEEPIRHDMEGDALSILDCCMASTAGMKCRNGVPRTYQLLAASPADAPTCAPGRNSFTTALCDSLLELLKEADGGTFTLTQLSERINTRRKSQACLPWDRLRSFKRTLQLGRLERCDSSENSFRNTEPEQSSLLLRLSFKTSDLDDEQIKVLAEQLPHACHEAKILLRRIDWIRMTTTERDVGRNLDIERHISDERDLQDDDLMRINENGLLERRPIDLFHASRAVIAAQRWRTAARKRPAGKRLLSIDVAAPSTPYFFIGAMILKLISLLFMFSMLYFRGEQAGLVLSGAMMAWMLMYGPCKLKAFRECPSGEASGYRGP
ncbi:hypothetical protein DE146DRAFT_240565 [Phaeosphaeria sp. MPI-PUGE-AT-0046c]|nr:hypothetical protein DE146DRAFT_240565 [Phaeosphaeria sp. MPI-PUGE-AT-0046c]